MTTGLILRACQLTGWFTLAFQIYKRLGSYKINLGLPNIFFILFCRQFILFSVFPCSPHRRWKVLLGKFQTRMKLIGLLFKQGSKKVYRVLFQFRQKHHPRSLAIRVSTRTFEVERVSSICKATPQETRRGSPVDDGPSTDYLHQFTPKKEEETKLHVTHDMWHVTYGERGKHSLKISAP